MPKPPDTIAEVGVAQSPEQTQAAARDATRRVEDQARQAEEARAEVKRQLDEALQARQQEQEAKKEAKKETGEIQELGQ